MLVKWIKAHRLYLPHSWLVITLLVIWNCPTSAEDNVTVADFENARVFGKHNVVQYMVYPESLSRINILERDIEDLFDRRNVQEVRDYRFAIRLWLIAMTFPQYTELKRRHPEVSR